MKPFLLISTLIASMVLLVGTGGPASQASVKHEEGNFRGALELYRIALAEYPNQNWPIKYNMAQCYMALDSLPIAIRHYQNARGQGTKNWNSLAFNNEGALRVETENKKLALVQFMAALKANPENEEALYNYETVYQTVPNSRRYGLRHPIMRIQKKKTQGSRILKNSLPLRLRPLNRIQMKQTSAWTKPVLFFEEWPAKKTLHPGTAEIPPPKTTP